MIDLILQDKNIEAHKAENLAELGWKNVHNDIVKTYEKATNGNTKDWKGNKNSIYKTLGASNHTKEERQSEDYYATDPIAIDKLLQVENICNNVWECACGENHLTDKLRSYGITTTCSDVVKRIQGEDIQIIDFLNCNKK